MVETGVPTAPQLVDMAQVRAMLGNIGRDAVYGLDSRGEIESTKIGSRRVWFRASIEDYIARKREMGPER